MSWPNAVMASVGEGSSGPLTSTFAPPPRVGVPQPRHGRALAAEEHIAGDGLANWLPTGTGTRPEPSPASMERPRTRRLLRILRSPGAAICAPTDPTARSEAHARLDPAQGGRPGEGGQRTARPRQSGLHPSPCTSTSSLACRSTQPRCCPTSSPGSRRLPPRHRGCRRRVRVRSPADRP